jgi:hypothetical protein
LSRLKHRSTTHASGVRVEHDRAVHLAFTGGVFDSVAAHQKPDRVVSDDDPAAGRST